MKRQFKLHGFDRSMLKLLALALFTLGNSCVTRGKKPEKLSSRLLAKQFECSVIWSQLADNFGLQKLYENRPRAFFNSEEEILEAQECKERLLANLSNAQGKFCLNYKASWLINSIYSQWKDREKIASLGYTMTDKTYARLNSPEISLQQALPDPLNFQHTSEQTRKEAQKIWRELYYNTNKVMQEKAISMLLQEKQISFTQEKWYSGYYKTKKIRGAGNTPDTYSRFVTLKMTQDCQYLVSTVPAASSDSPFNSMAVHSICLRPRLGGKTERLSFLFNFRAATPGKFDYQPTTALDGDCHECHSGKSAFIPLDVDPDSPQSDSLPQLLNALEQS